MKCRDLCQNVQAWNVTTTLISAFFLALGTVLLVQTCYVPDNDALTSYCASQTTVLFADKWVLVVLIAASALVLIVLYQILVATGLTCDGWCNNLRHTVFLSLVAAIASTVYADFVSSTLNTIPTSPIDAPDACFVCPNGRDEANLTALYLGVVVAFLGFAITVALNCSSLVSNDEPKSGPGWVHRELEMDMMDNDANGRNDSTA